MMVRKLYSSTEVSERVALTKAIEGGFMSGWAYAIPLRIEVRIIRPPPLQSQVMDLRPGAYNTYSTVVLLELCF